MPFRFFEVAPEPDTDNPASLTTSSRAYMASKEIKSSSEGNSRGIPRAPFVVSGQYLLTMRVLRSLTFQSDVEQHIGGPDAEVEPVLRAFQDAIAYVSTILSQSAG